jgi:hypothetical protein
LTGQCAGLTHGSWDGLAVPCWNSPDAIILYFRRLELTFPDALKEKERGGKEFRPSIKKFLLKRCQCSDPDPI